MKYIKWQDELESYLYSLPREEKEKAFSYFSEMYADKREAGLSEEEIVEAFGPPYDVAKRILSDCGQPADGFYAPPEPAPARRDYSQAEYRSRREYIRHEMPRPEEQPAPPAKEKSRGVGHMIGGIILAIIIFSLSATLIGGTIALMVDGFADIGAAIGGLVSGNMPGAAGAAIIGEGIMIAGGALILLAPVSALIALMWKKFKSWF